MADTGTWGKLKLNSCSTSLLRYVTLTMQVKPVSPGGTGLMGNNISAKRPFAAARLFPTVWQHSYCGEHQDREMDVIAPVPAREVHGRRCAAF